MLYIFFSSIIIQAQKLLPFCSALRYIQKSSREREMEEDTKGFQFYPQLNLIQKELLSSYHSYGYCCCVCFLFDSPK